MLAFEIHKWVVIYYKISIFHFQSIKRQLALSVLTVDGLYCINCTAPHIWMPLSHLVLLLLFLFLVSVEDQMEQSSLYFWDLLEGSEKAVVGTTCEFSLLWAYAVNTKLYVFRMILRTETVLVYQSLHVWPYYSYIHGENDLCLVLLKAAVIELHSLKWNLGRVLKWKVTMI